MPQTSLNTEHTDAGQSALGPVVLRPGDIFSKWGFGDGDVLSDTLNYYAKAAGFASGDGDWRYLDHHLLLWHTYHRYLATPEWEPVLYANTSHNPVRAVSEWEGGVRTRSQPDENADPVEIPAARILTLCEELFPRRERWWLDLHHALDDLCGHLERRGPLFTPHQNEPGPAETEGEFGPDVTIATATERVIETFSLNAESGALVARLLTAQRRTQRHASVSTAASGRQIDALELIRDAADTARAALA